VLLCVDQQQRLIDWHYRGKHTARGSLTLVTNVIGLASGRPIVEGRAVVCDPRGRILLVHAASPDVWILPGSEVEAGQTPGEAAVSTIKGTPPTDGHLIGVFTTRPPDERLIVAFRFESTADSIEEGVFLPLALAPLNTDPRHHALAARSPERGPSDARLELPTAVDHLRELRRHEATVAYDPTFIAKMLEVAGSRLATSTGADRSQQMIHVAEVMIGSGEIERGLRMLQGALGIAGIDDVTALRCELRLEELDDPAGTLIGAWTRLSIATEDSASRHADVILTHLGFAALRRGRRREAEAYLRRAMALCDEPGRRAALRVSLAPAPTKLISVSA
jgi:ADP-ribose pyrophosphatase YjhB (NUDIX family)